MATATSSTVSALPSHDYYRRLVSSYLRDVLAPLGEGVYALVAYHLGCRDANGRPAGGLAGKMLRPLLCLAACRGYGDPQQAVGAAAALELLHAFSLVHDDIEDGDQERRLRPTLWTLVGVPLAINAGDSLFALAQRALVDAVSVTPPDRLVQALRLFSDACLRMIEGQHLDIEFESRESVSIDEYLDMARRKTGALIGASLALGGLCGGAPAADVERLWDAGLELGLAFQAVDDALAVWGDPAHTGKAVGNDLARGKKSLPAVLAMQRGLEASLLQSRSLEAVREELQRLGVAAEVQSMAAGQALAGRRLLDETAMSAEGRQELDVLIDFILLREG